MYFEKDQPPIFLAPLAGVTDLAFREICKWCGADLTYSEMISAKGLLYGNRKTWDLLTVGRQEKRIAVQLFGSESKIVAQMARKIWDAMGEKVVLIDINMGCPVPKVVNNHEGSALMKNIPLAGEIVYETKKAVPIPVTVKFRKGFDEEHVNGVEFAKAMEQSGADWITVHGRTRQQMYQGKADWDIIAQIKQAVKIPVVGNGDVFDAPSAKRMLDQTGCDGVMVARGALGNPFIFREIKEYLTYGAVRTKHTAAQKMDLLLLQAKLAIQDKQEPLAMREIRKHAAWYTKGIKHGAKYRGQFMQVKTYRQLEELVRQMLQEL